MGAKFDAILGKLREQDVGTGSVPSGGSTDQVLAKNSATDYDLKWATGGSGTPATSVTDETTYGISKAVGVSTNYARQDHTHGSPATPTKTTVGLSNVPNVDTSTTANITDSTDKRFITDAQRTVVGNTSGTNSGDNATNTQYSGMFSGLAKITVAASAPGTPGTGDLWIDIS